MNVEIINYRAWDRRENKIISAEEIEKNNWALGPNGVMFAYEKKGDFWSNLDNFVTPLLSIHRVDDDLNDCFVGDIVEVYHDELMFEGTIRGVVVIEKGTASFDSGLGWFSSMEMYENFTIKGNIFEDAHLLDQENDAAYVMAKMVDNKMQNKILKMITEGE